ncbi:hypothetical protein [Rhizobium lentis]|uniref:hypothetical protein n=1 Tax=Rhizobium lentis TaxID=1138194 RepID=UPI002180C3A4|nr:hypothetical protein [Rhizobium lentis]
MIEVDLPDGSVAEFPDGTSPDVIKSALQKKFGGTPRQDMAPQSAEAQSLAADLSSMTQNPAQAIDNQRYERNREQYANLPGWKKPIIAATDVGNIIGDDLTFGFGDKLAAAARAPFTDKTYEEELAANRAGTQASRDRAGGAAYGADVAAALMMPRIGKAATATTAAKGVLPKAGRFVGGVVKGGAQGAGYGAVNALGHDQDIGEGATAGAAFGAAVPVIGGVLKGAGVVLKPFADAVRARTNPTGYASQKISERLANSGLSVEQAGKRAADQGLTLADVGGQSTRDLLRTTTNIPGKARDRVATQLAIRQLGQGDRLKSAVKDVFADPDGFITANEKLGAAWSKVGNEVYEPALSRKVVWTDRLKQFVDEPIFRRGLAQGVKIQRLESLAEGKPFNPVDYAITGFNAAGDPIISGVPNMRTLNVAKKGIDAIIGEMKNPLTGKLTEEGRATNMVQKAFLNEIDRWNPEYQKARGVWGGFAKVKEALEFGQKEALNLSPEAVTKSFKEMSEAERQAARIGIAEALRKKIDGAGYTNNAILRIFSNRQNTGVLKAAFPDAKSFADFRKTIFTEARKRATYDAVRGNSTTARQMADMFETGGMQEGFDAMKTVATGRPVAAALQFVGSRLRMLGGLTPQVADEISKRLMTSSPEVRSRITQELQQIEQSQISALQKRQAVQSLVGRLAVIAGPTAVMQSGN